jgi:hypothetical protein
VNYDWSKCQILAWADDWSEPEPPEPPKPSEAPDIIDEYLAARAMWGFLGSLLDRGPPS